MVIQTKIDQRIKELIENIPALIGNLHFREDPGLYFYRKTIKLRRKTPLNELLMDTNDVYLEAIYATLVSWGMNNRRAKMKYFDKFKTAILKNKKSLLSLEGHELDQLTQNEFAAVKRTCDKIYSNMDIMDSAGKLVSNSKTMHFILPDLIMPMDRQNTLEFFFGNGSESKRRFLTIFQSSYLIAKTIDLKPLTDEKWNLSIPKIIDNAIMSYMTKKYNKI